MNTAGTEGLRAGISERGKSSIFIFYNGEILVECDKHSSPVKRHLQGTGLSCVQTLNDDAYHAYHQDEQGSTAYITGGNGLNLYAYCGNNPVMYYDPSGHNMSDYEIQPAAEPELVKNAGEDGFEN